MSYRKIVVDDKTYEYVIGESIVKIKWKGEYLKSAIGTPRGKGKWAVTPGMIRDLIEGNIVRKIKAARCHHGTVTTLQRVDPYAAEINGEIRMMIDCDECADERAQEI